MNLPKQWKRWCRKAGLKLAYSSSLQREYPCHYMTGYGRHWRVNCNGLLDVSCTFDEFDRWALSLEESENMTDIKFESEFVSLVKTLLKKVEVTDGSSSEI